MEATYIQFLKRAFPGTLSKEPESFPSHSQHIAPWSCQGFCSTSDGGKAWSCGNIFPSLKFSQILEFGSHYMFQCMIVLHTHTHTHTHILGQMQLLVSKKGKDWRSIVKRIIRLLGYQRVLTKPHFDELSVNESKTYGLHFSKNSHGFKK